MNVKNKERIERMVISLEAILETDKLDHFEKRRIKDAVYVLNLICESYKTMEKLIILTAPEDEFDEDDLRV